jgi:TPR repeat protein
MGVLMRWLVVLTMVALGPALGAQSADELARTAAKGNKAALQQLRALADKGDAEAQFNLGAMYRNGEGVTRDYAAAVAWFRKAADQGLASAQYRLGLMYGMGLGVPPDSAQALAWYRKAAEQGYAAAQVNLGVIYGMGLGVREDFVTAYMWFNLAAAQDTVEGAKENRDSLAQQMTPQQIKEAQRLSREWKPTKRK